MGKVIEQAQAKVEGFHFDARKHLLDYDDVLNKQRQAIYKRRQEMLENNTASQILGMLDLMWMDHLEAMESLRESVRLRAYGQHDPLVEYRREGHRLYQEMVASFESWLTENEARFKQMPNTQLPISNEMSNVKIENSHQKVGRNEPCPCGAKKEDGRPIKYKKCHGK